LTEFVAYTTTILGKKIPAPFFHGPLTVLSRMF